MGPGARLIDALETYAEDLTAAGIPAATDRARVHTPGAYVTCENLDLTTLEGGGVARVHVVLVVADNDEATARAALAALFDAFTAAGHTFAEPVDTGWAAVIGPNSSPVPAWRVPVDLDF